MCHPALFSLENAGKPHFFEVPLTERLTLRKFRAAVYKTAALVECAEYKDSPDEFQITSVLIGALFVSDIDFYSADAAVHFSCQYIFRNFGKPFFDEICVSVIAIKACNGQYNPLTIIALLRIIAGKAYDNIAVKKSHKWVASYSISA